LAPVGFRGLGLPAWVTLARSFARLSVRVKELCCVAVELGRLVVNGGSRGRCDDRRTGSDAPVILGYEEN
jgi:hypothetical protein